MPKNSWSLRVASIAALLILTGGPAQATVVVEEPWHPLAAAYRVMLFVADLRPVDWDLLRSTYDEPFANALGSRTARSYVESLAVSGVPSPGGAIDSALLEMDTQALYESLTRATSAYLRQVLSEAAEAFGRPDQAGAGAGARLTEAQAVYRAFGDVILQADPAAGRRLGLAWLELSSSVGSAGVLGVGAVEADRQAFEEARSVIDTYLAENYQPAGFSPRSSWAPLPESAFRAHGQVALAPVLPPGSNLNDQDPLPLLVLNFEERGIDESDLPLIAFGDMLFDSPQIFGDPARSLGIACSTCHNRSDINQAFFIPGVSHQPGSADVDGAFFNPLFNDHRADSLDIPSLRGLRFTAPYGRDGRFGSLRDFTRNVIVNEFAGPEPTPFMLDALVAYMFEFDFLPNAKIDGQGRLTTAAPEAAHRGEVLFRRPFEQLDGKSCASCHVPSANFTDRNVHDIGSGSPGYDGSRDGAFDTPTLLGLRFTAPYMHDGSLPTLESVVAWFDTRHGLGLSAQERTDLTAYLEAVGDADQPYQAFDQQDTVFRLAWEELTTFASTLDTLIPLRDSLHARLAIDTIASELAADASGMSNLAAKAQVYALADLLAEVGRAIDEDDWQTAASRLAEFKDLQDSIDEEMY